jgi:hypothetical protein
MSFRVVTRPVKVRRPPLHYTFNAMNPHFKKVVTLLVVLAIVAVSVVLLYFVIVSSNVLHFKYSDRPMF